MDLQFQIQDTQRGRTKILDSIKRWSKSSDARNSITFLALVSPALLIFVVFMLWPLANMFRISLLQWNGILKPSTFIGFQNFSSLLQDKNFFTALQNSTIHIGVALPGVILPGFMLGYFLSRKPPGYRFLRAVFFSPVMISVAALSMIFLGVYLPDGIINNILRFIGLQDWTKVWLADPDTVLASIIVVDLWAGIGFYSVLFFAALSNLPDHLLDAAKIDGAGDWIIMWKIAFPYILDFVGVSTVLHFLWLLLGSAQNVLLLTRGGPGTYSLTLGYFLYDLAFVGKRLGYSQALGVVIFVIGIAGLLIIRKLTRRSYT